MELHTHLEGTITPSMAQRLAKRNGLDLPEGLIAADGTSYLSKGFLDFLKVYDTLAAVIKTPQDYYDITFDYLHARAKEQAIYVEMMYSPDHAEQASGIPSREHLAAIQQAIDDAQHQFAIIGRIIITAVRHYGAEAAERVARNIPQQEFSCVSGFGLGGDEANFPPQLFVKAYEIAAASGVSCTVHAGEFAPAEFMIKAMECLPIQRIGHGVNAIYSEEAMAMVKERDIALALCPTSNIFLGLFSSMAEHPLPKFFERGIKISISSDDPPFMSTTLGLEYQRVQEAYSYNDEKMNRITRMAIDAAFVDATIKKELHDKITSLS